MAEYPIEIGSPSKYPPGTGSLGALLNNVINAITVGAGVLLFLYLVYGGFKYMSAGGDEKAVDAAKKILTNAVIGLVIVVCAYFIVAIVGTILGFSDIFELEFVGP